MIQGINLQRKKIELVNIKLMKKVVYATIKICNIGLHIMESYQMAQRQNIQLIQMNYLLLQLLTNLQFINLN